VCRASAARRETKALPALFRAQNAFCHGRSRHHALHRNRLKTDPNKILTMNVAMTIVDGGIVFAR